MREGRLQPSQQQQLYIAYKDKALAAKEVFENGLQKQIEGGLNRCANPIWSVDDMMPASS